MHLRQRAGAALADRLDVRPRPAGFCSVPITGMPSSLRDVGQQHRLRDHVRAVVDRGHQPLLVVHQHERMSGRIAFIVQPSSVARRVAGPRAAGCRRRWPSAPGRSRPQCTVASRIGLGARIASPYEEPPMNAPPPAAACSRARHADERRRLPRVAAPLQADGLRRRPARRVGGRRARASRPASTRSASPTTSRCDPSATAADDRRCRRASGSRQPHAAHRRELGRRPAEQARGGAPALPGNRLRAALPGARRAERARPGQRAHRRRRAAAPSTGALPGLPAPRAGPGPDARHRDDRRQGRPQRRPHEQANPDTYVHIVERNAKGIVISRHQGDRHRRALHARVPGHALPQHGRGGRRLRGLLRGAGRCARPHHRRAPGRPARREARARRGAVLAPLRPVAPAW